MAQDTFNLFPAACFCCRMIWKKSSMQINVRIRMMMIMMMMMIQFDQVFLAERVSNPSFFWFLQIGIFFQMLLKETTYLRNHHLYNFTLSHIWNMLLVFLPWSELPTVTTGLGCNKVDTQRDFESPWEWAVAFLMLFRGNIVWITLKHDLCLIYVQYYLVYFCWRALTEH